MQPEDSVSVLLERQRGLSKDRAPHAVPQEQQTMSHGTELDYGYGYGGGSQDPGNRPGLPSNAAKGSLSV